MAATSQEQLNPQALQTEQPPPGPDQSINITMYIVLAVCVIGITGALTYRFFRQQKILSDTIPIDTKQTTQTTQIIPETQIPTPAQSPTPSPTPIQLKAGIGEYAISHPKSLGPRIRNVSFSPLDVHRGETLSVSTTLTSDTPIDSVTGTLSTDSGTTDVRFTYVSSESARQIWSAQLPMTDTVWYTYILTITAKNMQGTTKATVAPRS